MSSNKDMALEALERMALNECKRIVREAPSKNNQPPRVEENRLNDLKSKLLTGEADQSDTGELISALLDETGYYAWNEGFASVKSDGKGASIKGIRVYIENDEFHGMDTEGNPWNGELQELLSTNRFVIERVLEKAVGSFFDGEIWRLKQGMTGLPRSPVLKELATAASGWKDFDNRLNFVSKTFGEGVLKGLESTLKMSERNVEALVKTALFDPTSTLSEMNELSKNVEGGSLNQNLSVLTLLLRKGAGFSQKLSDSFVGETRDGLRKEFGLSKGGWKALSSVAERASVEDLVSLTRIRGSLRNQGLSNTLASQKLSKAVVSLANAAAENRTLTEATKILSIFPFFGETPDGFWSYLYSSFESLPSESPLWMSEVENPREKMKGTWKRLTARHGLGERRFMEPETMRELMELKWEPEGREFFFKTMEDERKARMENFPYLLAAMAEEIVKTVESSGDKELLINQIEDVLDMFTDDEPGSWMAYKGGRWADILKQSRRWHIEVGERNASKFKWEKSDVEGSGLPGGLSAVELTDGGMLHKEGQNQRHCVSKYGKDCSNGKSKIFSLRSEDGKAHATLELVPVEVKKDGSWLGAKLVQAKGFANCPLEGTVREAAIVFAERVKHHDFGQKKSPKPR